MSDKDSNFPETEKSEPKPLKIQIPKGLPEAIAHNSEVRKAVSFYLYLKARYNPHGRVPNTHKERLQLATELDCSYKTLENRLKVLLSLQLCKYSQDNAFILLCSWDNFNNHFNLMKPGYRFMKYRYIKFTGRRLDDILEALFIQEKKEQCKQAAKFKLHKNSLIANEVLNVTGELSLHALKHSQLHYFINENKGLTEDEVFSLNICRGDSNLSYKQWSWYFGYNSRGGFAYKKRKLIKAGLIVVTPQLYEIKAGTHTTKSSRVSNVGRVKWHSAERKLVLHCPDKIDVLNPSFSVFLNSPKSISGEANLQARKVA